MEFSLGWDTLPSPQHARRVRRLRRNPDHAKTLSTRRPHLRIARRDRAVAIKRPVFSATWRTAADAKSAHDHLSRHHAGVKIERARFGIGLGTNTYMPAGQSGNRCGEPLSATSSPRSAVRRIGAVTSGAASAFASLVTLSNHNLIHTMVINSSQRRTCATMLTLTSHY